LLKTKFNLNGQNLVLERTEFKLDFGHVNLHARQCQPNNPSTDLSNSTEAGELVVHNDLVPVDISQVSYTQAYTS